MALNLTKRSELTRALTKNELDQNFQDIEDEVNAITVATEAYTGWNNYEDDVYTTGSPFSLTTAAGMISIPNHANTSVSSQLPSDINEFYYATELSFTNLSGTFVVGETVTGGTSGATGVISRVETNSLYLNDISTTDFVDTEEITGGTSSATADLDDDPTTGRLTGQEGDAYNIVIEMKVRPTSGASNIRLQVVIDIGGAVGEIYPRDFSLTKGNGVEHFYLSSFNYYTLNTFEANGGDVKFRVFNSTVEVYDIRYVITRIHKAR